MNKRLFVALFALMLFFSGSVETHAYVVKSEQIKIGSQTKHVSYVAFDPTENLALQPVLAEGRVGRTAWLADMAKQHQAAAAINGTFFNAYDQEDLQPMGVVMINREVQHVRGGNVTLGISTGNELAFGPATGFRILGGLKGSWEYPNTWNVWFVNHLPTSDNESVLFTPSFRTRTLHIPEFRLIVVEKGIVTEITKDQAIIPDEGFVIAYGPAVQNDAVVARFEVGMEADYRYTFSEEHQHSRHILGTGQKLITEGKVDVDFERDGIRDPKMTTARGQRSFIGTKQDGTVVFGTVTSSTIHELAEVLIQLGLYEAVNLDGGASSGLYVDGRYLTSPGRAISNALVLIPKPREPRIYINDEELFFADAAPFITNGSTMVPVRGVFEQLGAEIHWNGETNTVLARRFDTEIELTVGSTQAFINGIAEEMPIPSVNRNGRVYIPLRFVSQALGAEVAWDGALYRVDIKTIDEEALEESAKDPLVYTNDRIY